MLNKIIIQGRLCKDVELRKLPSGKSVASVSVACDRDFTNKETNEKETDFIDIVAFGGTADHLTKWFSKGSMVIVSGRLQIRNWTDKEGNKRRNAEVVADSVYFGDSKKSSDGATFYQPANTYQAETGGFAAAKAMFEQAMNTQPDFVALEDDDAQLPF